MSKIEFKSGEELEKKEVVQFAVEWANEEFGPINATKEDTQARVAKMLSIATDEERQNYINQNIGLFERLIANGDVIVAKIEGKVAGIIGLERLSPIGPNNVIKNDLPVFEIRKAMVFREFRGKKIYPMLREAILEHAKTKYGSVNIISVTKNDIVKKFLIRSGFQETSLEEYMRIRNRDEAIIKNSRQCIEANGRTMFWSTI